MVFGLGRRPGPEVVGAIVEEEKRSEPQADFTCVQGNIGPEHEVMGGGLIRVRMNFYASKPDPLKPRRNPFSGSAIMTKEEYSALSDSGGGINPDLKNSMGFIDDKDEEGNAVEITPKAKMILEEERTKKAVAESSKISEEVSTPSDDDTELDDEQIENKS